MLVFSPVFSTSWHQNIYSKSYSSSLFLLLKPFLHFLGWNSNLCLQIWACRSVCADKGLPPRGIMHYSLRDAAWWYGRRACQECDGSLLPDFLVFTAPSSFPLCTLLRLVCSWEVKNQRVVAPVEHTIHHVKKSAVIPHLGSPAFLTCFFSGLKSGLYLFIFVHVYIYM